MVIVRQEEPRGMSTRSPGMWMSWRSPTLLTPLNLAKVKIEEVEDEGRLKLLKHATRGLDAALSWARLREGVPPTMLGWRHRGQGHSASPELACL